MPPSKIHPENVIIITIIFHLAVCNSEFFYDKRLGAVIFYFSAVFIRSNDLVMFSLWKPYDIAFVINQMPNVSAGKHTEITSSLHPTNERFGFMHPSNQRE